MNQQHLQLPEGFTLLENQVAGHTFTPDSECLGMLKDVTVGCILKPMGKPQCGERELRFYEKITNATDPILAKACDFVPKFYNKVKLQVNCKEHEFLKLENLSHGMKKPCIMDIKIGQRTWDPLASPKKRQQEELKYFHSKQVLGLCLPGFQVYKNDVLEKHGKDYGKQLDVAALRKTIWYFLNAEQRVCCPIIREVLRQLYAIRDWFRNQTLLHFYASSLLIVYDYEALQLVQNAQRNGSLLSNGDAETQIKESSNHLNFVSPITHNNMLQFDQIEDFVKVRMIDFAHVFPAEGDHLDNNYLFGLENLIKIVEEIK